MQLVKISLYMLFFSSQNACLIINMLFTFIVEFDVVEALATRFMAYILVHYVTLQLIQGQGVIQGFTAGLHGERLTHLPDTVSVLTNKTHY